MYSFHFAYYKKFLLLKKSFIYYIIKKSIGILLFINIYFLFFNKPKVRESRPAVVHPRKTDRRPRALLFHYEVGPHGRPAYFECY
jgi:hypothetical protein